MEQVRSESPFSSRENGTNGTAGFTLVELIVCLAILTILIVVPGAIHLYLYAVEGAKAVEATTALTEVVRLERLHYADRGTYSSDFNELGFWLASSLKYTQIFVQVQKDTKGWSYIAFATPLGGTKSDGGGWAVAQSGSGKLQTNLPGTLKSGGTSACSIWSGWGSMEGGRIEGEESLSFSSSSSSGGGGSPCAGMKVISHGKR